MQDNVAAITNYDNPVQPNDKIRPKPNGGNGYTGATPYDIIIQTAGNRSLLANDFVQINDLGYGLIANPMVAYPNKPPSLITGSYSLCMQTMVDKLEH